MASIIFGALFFIGSVLFIWCCMAIQDAESELERKENNNDRTRDN